ncbi:MAG: ATP-binding cassette domain-containing protein, partial [Burkholderiales bacterium]
VKNNEAWIDEILDNLDLSAKANANMRQLSGGMKRRVLVAQALVHRPPVIILDEPTAGVDVELRQTLWKFVSRLNREGHTIVLTTHYLEEAEELCGRIAMLKGGRIVAMEPTHQLLNRIAGVQLILRAPGAEIARAQTLPEGRLLIKLPGYDEVEPVLADLRARGIKIEELEVRRADLEDVFMKIMTETQRISSLADAARLSGVAA